MTCLGATWQQRVQHYSIGCKIHSSTSSIGRLGLNLQRAHVLDERGRNSGQVRSVVVNPVEHDGVRYLFSPRGETQWMKNLRVDKRGAIRRGKHSVSFVDEELTDDEKPGVIRAYLDRWHWQVGSIIGVEKDPDDTTLRDFAVHHPVFRIIPPDSIDSSLKSL